MCNGRDYDAPFRKKGAVIVPLKPAGKYVTS